MIVLFKFALLLSFGIFVIPKKRIQWLAFALQLMLIIPTTTQASAVLMNQLAIQSLPA